MTYRNEPGTYKPIHLEELSRELYTVTQSLKCISMTALSVLEN